MISAPARQPGPVRDRAGYHLRANAPVIGWLLAVVVVAVAHRWIPESRWLLVHLLMIGAITTAIVVWSAHFTDALLRRKASLSSRRWQGLRVAGVSLGALILSAGMITATWVLSLIGGVILGLTVGSHAVALALQARAALPSRFGRTVRFYIVAGLLFPLGATLGIILATGLSAGLHARVLVAHMALNILGFVGITIMGTLVTLWPTMLRTRIDDRAEPASRGALVLLAGGVLITAAAGLFGLMAGVIVGLVAYGAGIVRMAVPMVKVARNKAPAAFPTLSVLAGLAWFLVSLAWLTVLVFAASSWPVLATTVGEVTAALTAGFAAQVLLGALTYLVPVVLGGGPSVVRVTKATLERGGAFRVGLANAGLVLFVLPVPSLVMVIGSLVTLGAYLAFIPLLIRAIVASRKLRHQGPNPAPRRDEPQPSRVRGPFAVAATAMAVLVAGAVAADPAPLGLGSSSAADGVSATGDTEVVRVETLEDMTYSPSTIEVEAGTHLILEVVNTDPSQVHDLVLDNGASTGRLAPGEETELDVGVVGRDIEGWCSVIGHRQMGMELTIVATGATAEADTDGDANHDVAHAEADGEAVDLDLMREPDGDFEAPDAELPPLDEGTVHEHTFTVTDEVIEVAPGVTQTLWTFNETVPGPTLHGRVGDTFVITLINDGSIGHSIDFHAGALAPDEPMRTIEPGEELTYTFSAERSGIWMYHCGTAPMSSHIANGMFGVVIIEPPDLEPVDHSFVMLGSEYYLGPEGGEVDMDKLNAEDPDLVVFNGYSNAYQYDPLEVQTGDRVRFWVLAIGPNRPLSFHVIGGQFDTMWTEGSYDLQPDNPSNGGAQVLPLLPAQGGFVELEFPEAGNYPFVSHIIADAERGASGTVTVTDP